MPAPNKPNTEKDRESLIAEIEELRERLREVGHNCEVCHRTAEVRSRFASIIESSEDAIIAEDLDGTVTLWNAAAERLYGYGAHEIVGQSIDILEPAEMRDELLDRLRRVGRGERFSGLERRQFHKDGTELIVSLSLSPIEDHATAVVGVSTIAEDITQRKRAEHELWVAKEYAESLVRSSLDMIISVDNERRIVEFNPAAECSLGYTKAEVMGQPVDMLYEDNQESRAVHDASLSGGGFAGRVRNRSKNGEVFTAYIAAAPLRDSQGSIIGVMGISRDISARLENERKLHETTRSLAAVNERLMESVDAAAKVQRALLPEPHPQAPGVKFAWRFRPCEGLAGDLLNIVRIDEDHVGLYVLDVSGHGAAAALMSVAVSRVLQPTLSATSLIKKRVGTRGHYTVPRPAEVVSELNRTFPWDPKVAQFFTIAYAVLNCRRRTLRFTTAGHPGIVHLPAGGRARLVKTPGLPVCVGDGTYTDETLQLQPGDRFFLNSDGIEETMDPESRELFGETRFMASLEKGRDMELDHGLSDLLNQLANWRKGTPLHDDISLLGCEVLQS